MSILEFVLVGDEVLGVGLKLTLYGRRGGMFITSVGQ